MRSLRHVAETLIKELLLRKQVTCSQGSLDRRGHVKIGQGSRGGLHIGDQMRQVLIAALRQMDFVAGPGC